MLERTYLDNVKCCTGFEWRPGKVALVTGAGGSGKRALLDALYAMREFFDGHTPIDRLLPHRWATAWERRARQRFEADVRSLSGGREPDLEVLSFGDWFAIASAETDTLDRAARELGRYVPALVELICLESQLIVRFDPPRRPALCHVGDLSDDERALVALRHVCFSGMAAMVLELPEARIPSDFLVAWVADLRRAALASEDAQLILCSNHQGVATQFAPDETFHLTRPDGEPTRIALARAS